MPRRNAKARERIEPTPLPPDLTDPPPPRIAVMVIDSEGVHAGTLTADERGDLIEVHERAA